jgi:hypothetical protein
VLPCQRPESPTGDDRGAAFVLDRDQQFGSGLEQRRETSSSMIRSSKLGSIFCKRSSPVSSLASINSSTRDAAALVNRTAPPRV